MINITEEIRLRPRKIASSINKLLLKEKVNPDNLRDFKLNFYRFLSESEKAKEKNQTEENFKNILKIFLEDSFYKNKNAINTKSYKGLNEADLVIHNGKTQDTNVSVIIEVKTPKNKNEMISKYIVTKPFIENLYKKSFYEAVLYFLWESIDKENVELKNIIITNIYEYFIFDASVFKRIFLDKSTKLVNTFKKWRNGELIDNKTDTMYSEVEKYIKANHEIFKNLRFTYFDIREFKEDKEIELLYKVFSDKHLLKQSFENDSNTLNKNFYNELLHIIGLEEIEQGSQKLIQRKKNPDNQSLLENTINIIEEKDKLDNLTNKSNFGINKDEILFNVALSLCIRWINRILFLKLLEGQLYKYHSDKSYKFLDSDKINNFDNMSKLFFSVLAKQTNDRKADIQKDNFRVPYLNSSLFEISLLENEVIDISSLDNNLELPIYKNTVLEDNRNKKRKGKLSTLTYLLDFLNSYDFGSEEDSDKEVSEKNKTLINASVLGLIFEKINGYKDGSFYTPSFITTYMCRESIHKAVIQKFNEKYNWNCSDIEELNEKIEDKKEANQIINSLKICDPAVGSGHFLVSALNEIITLKSELRVLFDTNGTRLKGYKIENYNDELIVTDEDDDIFEYKVSNAYDFDNYVERKIAAEKTRVQKALFFEKKNLIENCLFGVDINNNSVMICGLRLWIELLKSAYYTEESNYRELETLPNIDINIKQGNSLISRFDLDINLSTVFNKKGFSVKEYREKVRDYKETNSKEDKKSILKYITDIKSQFKTEISTKELSKIQLFENETKQLESNLFGIDKETKKKIAEKKQKLDEMLKQKEEIESSLIYKDAFEWRFEFPEVLDENGDFSGFDLIIANPPYVFARENFSKEEKNYFVENYESLQYQVNTYVLFIEKAIKLLSINKFYSLIVPNSWLMVSSCKNLRDYLLKTSYITEIINLLGYSFEGVNVETIVFNAQKTKLIKDKTKIFKNLGKNFISTHSLNQEEFKKNENFEFNVFSDDLSSLLIKKISLNTKILDDIVNIKAGLKAYQTGKGTPKQTTEDVKNRPFDYKYKFDESTHKYLEGKDVNRYFINWSGNYLRFGKHLAEPRIFNGDKIIIREITGKYPTSIIATYTEDLFLFNMSNIVIISKDSFNISLKYILVLLNSNLMSFYFKKNTAKAERKMFPKIILKDLRKFPIKILNDEDQKPFIEIADQILEKKKLNIDTTDLEKQIDEMVYKLYDLTDDEIKIIEELK